MANKVKIKINSKDTVAELLQETYIQACEQLNQVQSEMNKIDQSTTMGNGFTMDEKAKYGKIMHDFLGDKEKAIRTKVDIAKLLAEIISHNGNVEEALADKAFNKQPTSLNLEQLRKSINNADSPEVYTLK